MLPPATLAGLLMAAGPPPPDPHRSPVHFRPVAGNFADPVPFFWAGRYHVFYLRGDVPKVPWEHLVSRDLRTWQELPTALTADGPADSADGLHQFTGCVVEHAGTFHLFYTGFNPADPAGRESVRHATSRDLVRWAKHPEHAFRADGRVYSTHKGEDFRDPFVFWHEQERRWWMLLCCRAAAGRRPVTGVYASSDLVKWQPLPPLCDDWGNTPECPDLFRLGDRWHLITSPSENVVTARTAPAVRGPWSAAPGAALDTPILYAAKRQFDGRRHVLTGWLRDLEDGKDTGGFRWGGTQCVPREVFAGPDGTALTRPVPEARAAYPKTVLDLRTKPAAVNVGGGAAWRYAGDALVGDPGTAAARVRLHPPADYHLSLTATMTGPNGSFGLLLRQGDGPSDHYRLEVWPAAGRATLAGPTWDYPRAVPFAPGAAVTVEAFVQGSTIECWVNGGHAFSCRAYGRRTGGLDLLVNNGRAEVTELVVRTP